jgi:hypothetical protein
MTSSGLEIVNTDGAVVSLIVSGSYARSISERWDRPDEGFEKDVVAFIETKIENPEVEQDANQ